MDSVATAIAGVFANFTNKIGKMTEELEDVDKAKSQGVSCQRFLIAVVVPNTARGWERKNRPCHVRTKILEREGMVS